MTAGAQRALKLCSMFLSQALSQWHGWLGRELRTLRARSAALPCSLQPPMAVLEVDAGAREHCARMAEAAEAQARRRGVWEVAVAECAVAKLRRVLLCGAGERLEVAAFRRVPGCRTLLVTLFPAWHLASACTNDQHQADRVELDSPSMQQARSTPGNEKSLPWQVTA